MSLPVIQFPRPRRLLPIAVLGLLLAGSIAGGAATASAQATDDNGTQPVVTASSGATDLNGPPPVAAPPSSEGVPVYATLPGGSSYVAPVVAPTAFGVPGGIAAALPPPPVPNPSVPGSYCSLPNVGGQVFITAGSSPALYGC